MRNRNYKNQNNNVVEKENITNSNKVQIVDDTVSNIEEPIVENVVSEKEDVADVVIKAKVVNCNNFGNIKASGQNCRRNSRGIIWCRC